MAAALLFGAGTPLAKQLLTGVDPWMLAGRLYLGSGLGLGLGAWRLVRHAQPVRLPAGQRVWLAGAVLAGGAVRPLLLMFGLTRIPASGASLLLNACVECRWLALHPNPWRRACYWRWRASVGKPNPPTAATVLQAAWPSKMCPLNPVSGWHPV